jgi:hypothetical protein
LRLTDGDSQARRARLTLNPVNLAVRIGSGIDSAVLIHRQRLYLQLLRLKDGR